VFCITQIKFINIAEKEENVCFLSGREGSASYGRLYAYTFFETRANLCTLSLISKGPKIHQLYHFLFIMSCTYY